MPSPFFSDIGRDRFRVDLGWIDIEAGAGLEDFADDQADGECHRRDRLEIDQRFQANPADALQVARRGNAVHHGAEDHRCDHHLDESMKPSPNGFNALPSSG
jgi:hypothetical protein